MHWRTASTNDAAQLVDLVNAAGSNLTPTEVAGLLMAWSVEIGHDSEGTLVTAVAVRPPPDERNRRAYGAWWDRRPDGIQHCPHLIDRMVEIAERTPATRLQLSLPTDHDRTDAVLACGFSAAYPIWIMAHDRETWPADASKLPEPLRLQPWRESLTDSFVAAYSESYQDQRVVDPHSAKTWRAILAEESFSSTISALAIAPGDLVVGFVLAFENASHVELGPIGTVPSWRGHGVSTVLLQDVLKTCRERDIRTIGLTVDGDSPTGAQRLYLSHGFTITEELIAYQRTVSGSQ